MPRPATRPRPSQPVAIQAFPDLLRSPVEPCYRSQLGLLFEDDCLKILPQIRENTVDLVFADPPFNLRKQYGRRGSDQRPDLDYIRWCKSWMRECVRVLRTGGAFFLFNLPKWNIQLAPALLEFGMEFRHWIAIELYLSQPFTGRLSPAHYGLLYFTKGPPRVFRRIRTPIARCKHCDRPLRTYGGHRKFLHPDGILLKDVWTDVPPVREARHRLSGRSSNALSTRITDRAIQLATQPGDLVLDPFGGSGTTFDSAQRLGRRWLGIEINATAAMIERLNTGIPCPHDNSDRAEP